VAISFDVNVFPSSVVIVLVPSLAIVLLTALSNPLFYA
jgi:hypothetical protein